MNRRSKRVSRVAFKALCAAAMSVCVPYSRAAVTLTKNSSTNWTITNGSITAVFDPSAEDVTSVQLGSSANLLGTSTAELDEEFAGTPFGGGPQTFNSQVGTNGSYVDVWTSVAFQVSNGTVVNPITYAFHYLIFANDPTIYCYEVLNHSATDPATSVGQGQFLFRSNPTLFPNLYQISTGPNQQGISNAVTTLNIPSTNSNWSNASAVVGRQVQNATVDLTGSGIPGDNGTNFFTKYDYSIYTQFFQAETMYGPNYAVTEVDPATDTLTGGSTKQELAYTDPGILNMEFLSDHYGIDGSGAGAFPGYAYYPTQGVATQKLYGPYGFTISSTAGTTAAAINQNAIAQVANDHTEFNSDAELATSGYINTLNRGMVQINNVANSAGWSSNTSNNTVVLSEPGVNFQESTQGYQYIGQLSQSGSVAIPGVVPGNYRLSIYQLGQWGETRVDGVVVNGNTLTLPQNLKFTPENFSTSAPIWTIGTPNRSANEFLNGHNSSGQDQRQYYGAYDYWAEEAALGTPGYVSYNATATTINGVAQPATNNPNAWLANQWGSFDPGLYDPSNNTSDNYNKTAPAYVTAGGGPANYYGAPWQIHFTTTAAQQAQGQYIALSVGLAAAEGSLTISLNNVSSGTWHVVNQSDPMIRSGDAGYYQFLVYEFPTSELSAPGQDNVFYLSTSQTDGDMYDALRMEITNTNPSPSSTGWYDYEYITGPNTQTDANDAVSLTATNTFSGTSQWALSTGGSWSAASNWNNYIIPGSTGDVATFGNTLTNAGTITLDGNRTVGGIIFNSSAASYTIAAGAGGTLTLNQSGGTAVISDLGGSHTISAPVSLVSNVQVNIASSLNSLTFSGPISGAGSFILAGAGTVSLSGTNSYTGSTNVSSGTLILDFTETGSPVTNIVSSASSLTMAGGNLYVNGISSSSSQTFASTTLSAASSGLIVATQNVSLSLGVISATEGSSIVLYGPATVTGLTNTAASAVITTTATSGGLLQTGANNNAFATVGPYDWASANGSGPVYTIVGGSQVPGFYTAVANNTNPGAVNWNVSTQQTPTGPGGTNEGRISTGTQYPTSIRFNTPTAPEITVASGTYLETGGVLVTPDLGSVNTDIDGLRLSGTGVQIVQNNTGAVLIIGSGNGSGSFSSNSSSTAENVVKSGPGTLFLAPTANNLALNYQNSAGAIVTVNTTSYNYSNAQSTSQYALFLNGGVTVINNSNVLGNPASQSTGYAAGGSVNLNGGTLMGDISNVSLINPAASNANRPVWIGPAGGGLAAGTGTTLTVAGLIESSSGNGVLTVGIPASSVNGNIAGLVPGTGGTTPNSALNANGTVTLTAANGFTGGTILDSGTLNINGYYALGGANYGGLTFNGGTLQYATALNGSNGSADVSISPGITVAAGGGTIDLNGNAVNFANSIGNGGTGKLTIVSNDASHAGVLTLAGSSTLTGGINLSSGTLAVTGTLSSTTPVTVNSGATLLGNGSAGAVTLAGGTVTPGFGSPYISSLSMSNLIYNSGTLQFGLGASSAGNISTGLATFNTKPTISFVFTGSPANGSSYTLVSSASAITGSSYLSGLTPTTIGRFTLTPSESGTTQIIVTVNGSAGALVWNNGAGNNLWNIQTSANWLNNNSNAEDIFYQGDNVTFNDSNGGAANYNVIFPTAVQPLSVNINNSSGSYVFNGSGSIGGATSLVKSGSKTLTLNTTGNNYSGGTIINAGMLQIGVSNALPTSGAVTVQGTGDLDLDGNSQTIGGLSDGGVSTGTITSSTGSGILMVANISPVSYGGAINGSAGIVVAGSSSLTLLGVNSFTGHTNVSTGSLIVAGNLALGSANSSTGGLIVGSTVTATFTASAPAIASLSGSGSVILYNSSGTTLTVGGGNQSTTFSGVISDLSGTTPGAIGNLTLVGSGTLTLTNTNTFSGNITPGGASTLMLGNQGALEYSTLNCSTGNLSFGTFTSATLGGISGTTNLPLLNSNLAYVALTVGNNGGSTTYSGSMTGGGSLTKVGSGTLTLAKTNTYTGNTTISLGNLTVGSTGSIGSGTTQGSVTVGDNGNLTVSGGTIAASYFTTNSNGQSTVLLSGGSITVANSLAVDSDQDDDQGVVTITGGTLTAASATVGRTGQNNGTTIQSAGSTTQGIYVNGGTLHITGALSVGTGAVESSANVRMDSGMINVGGLTTVTVDNSRFTVFDISGGTFNGSGGLLIGGNFDSSSPYAEVLLRGSSLVNVSGITFGNSTQTGGENVLELYSGTTYIGSGGMVNNSSSNSPVVPVINFGSSSSINAPILAANASWSSSLAMTMTNTNAGLTPIIQAANALGAAFNISLSGPLSGSAGLTKTGAGVLTLSNAGNLYSGSTNVSAGTLVSGVFGALPGGTNLTVALGATLVSDSQKTVTNLGSLNLNGNMIVHGGTLATLTKEAAEGYNAGGWNGTNSSSGIPFVSTSAAGDLAHLHALGVIQNDNGLGSGAALYSLFEGQLVSDSDILLKYTWYGDATLNGDVDGTDYARIDAAYTADQSNPAADTGWFNGDFNYDGLTNGSDYTLMDNVYNRQGTPIAAEIAVSTAAIAGVGESAVPEPASGLLITVAALALFAAAAAVAFVEAASVVSCTIPAPSLDRQAKACCRDRVAISSLFYPRSASVTSPIGRSGDGGSPCSVPKPSGC